jgi:hypothetical protein
MRRAARAHAVRAFARAATLAAALLVAPAASADDAPAPLGALESTTANEPAQAHLPGYFNGVGTTGRYWELASDSAFGTKRVFTQRFDLARALTIRGPLTLVVRANFGGDAALDRGESALQGPIFALGLRDHSTSDNYSVEFGVRLVPSWSGPSDSDPTALQLALGATLTSGIADDARWLSFSDTGFQIYGSFESRTDTFDLRALRLWLGTRYGGEASLLPMKVRSWLGPQTGFIGNAFFEFAVGLPHVADADTNLEIGGHGEVSLSSNWPSDDAFPLIANAFVGWSPVTWLSLRVFGGAAILPTSRQPAETQYGLRLAFYLP